MSKPPRVILCILLVSSFLAARPRAAWACSCAAFLSAEEEMRHSTAVFSGRVMDVGRRWTFDRSAVETVRVTFDVDRVWKGPARGRLVAYTASGGASCGYGFAEGEEYLVYADGTENELKVYMCSRTMPLVQAGEDLAALGLGAAPAAVGVDQPVIPAVLLGVLALGLMLFVVRSSDAEDIREP